MSTPICAQMLALYDKYSARAGLRLELLKACGFSPDMLTALSLEKKVRQRFLLGVHNAFQEVIMTALENEFDTQQEMADALGLDDRSNIPHIRKSGKIEGIRFSTALYRLSHLIELPSRELAALYGFARATSFLKALASDTPSIEGTMRHQDFSYLIGVLSESGWDAAVRGRDPLPARALATRIILDRTIGDFGQNPHSSEHPERLVKMLQELRNHWGYYAVLSLLIIPDDIPEDVAHGEVTT